MKLSKEKSREFLQELTALIHKYDLDNGTNTHSAIFADYVMENVLSVASLMNLRDALNKGMEEAIRDDRLLRAKRDALNKDVKEANRASKKR